MDTISANRKRKVSSRIKQNARVPASVPHSLDDEPRKVFQVPRCKVFLAQLDVVNAGTSSFGNLCQ